MVIPGPGDLGYSFGEHLHRFDHLPADDGSHHDDDDEEDHAACHNVEKKVGPQLRVEVLHRDADRDGADDFADLVVIRVVPWREALLHKIRGSFIAAVAFETGGG